MAAQTITFTQEGDKYISAKITASSQRLVIRIEFEEKGGCNLLRSITGSNFVLAAPISTKNIARSIEEFTVENIVPGQILMLEFFYSKPKNIWVLQ